MIINKDLSKQVSDGLLTLQDDGRTGSINNLAKRIGVPERWLHRVKVNGIGSNTVDRYVMVFNYLLKNNLISDGKTAPICDKKCREHVHSDSIKVNAQEAKKVS